MVLGGLLGPKRDKFHFELSLHSLAPFPELPANRALTVAWNRGSKRHGMVGNPLDKTGGNRPFVPVPRGRGRLGYEIQMGFQCIRLGATLERLPRNGSALQEYKKKCLVIALLETNLRTGQHFPLGRVVMDLADFALINGQETRSFIVTCKKEVIQVVGHPQLLVTIRNLKRGGGKVFKAPSSGISSSTSRFSDDDASDATSVSSYGTDMSGTGSAANVSSFLRQKYTSQHQMPALTESSEQDLEGFEGVEQPANTGEKEEKERNQFSGPGGAVPSSAALKGFMGTIQEGQGSGDEGEGENEGKNQGSHPPTSQPPAPPAQQPAVPAQGAPANKAPLPAVKPGQPSDESRSIAATLMALPAEERSMLLSHLPHYKQVEVREVLENPSLLTPRAAAEASQCSLSSTTTSPLPTPAQPAQQQATPSDGMSPAPSMGRSLSLGGGVDEHGHLVHGGNSMLRRAIYPFRDVESLQLELLHTAAQEVCVLMARTTASSSGKGLQRAYHAPARRLARTLVCLGPTKTSDFALHMLRLIATQVRTAGLPQACELPTLAFWWSNLAHLRALLSLPKVNAWLSLPSPPGDADLQYSRKSESTTEAGEVNGAAPSGTAPSEAPSSATAATAAAAAGAQQQPGSATSSSISGSPFSMGGSLAAMLTPHVARIERAAAEAVLEHVWNDVLLATVTRAEGASSKPPTAHANGHANDAAAQRAGLAAKRAQQESAMARWAAAFEHLGRVLALMGAAPGSAALLSKPMVVPHTASGKYEVALQQQQQESEKRQSEQAEGAQEPKEVHANGGEQQQQEEQSAEHNKEGFANGHEHGTHEQQQQQQHECGGGKAQHVAALGHVSLLQRQILEQCLARADALLFYHLLTPPGTTDPSLLVDYMPPGSSALWGRAVGTATPQLPDCALPFTRGQLSFGSGMHIKVAVNRMQQWCAQTASILGVHPSLSPADAGPHASKLFPMLRGAADLLMMPKEMLLDGVARRDVTQSLTLRSVLHMVQHFQADDYAPEEGVAQGVAAKLREDPEFAAIESAPAQGTSGQAGPLYQAPPAEWLTTQLHTNVEPGVVYEADSEDELMGTEGIAKKATGPGRYARYMMLHGLWASFKG